MDVSLDNFTLCSPPVKKTIKGMDYEIIAYRYDMYGIFVYVYFNNGRLSVMLWQDDHPSSEPIFFNCSAKRVTTD